MLNAALHFKIHYFLSCLIAFILPFKFGTSLFIALLVCNWLLEGNFRSRFSKRRSPGILLVLLLFYGLHVIGLLWSTDRASGLFELQVKLSLLIFPLIYSTAPLNDEKVNTVFRFFIGGCLAVSIYLIAHAAFVSFTEGEARFFYGDLSYFLHPSYLSMYFNLVIIYLLLELFHNRKPIKGSYILLLFFTGMILLLGSKTGYITLFLTGVIWLILSLIKGKGYKLALLSFLSLVIITSFVTVYSGVMSERFQSTLSTLLNFENTSRSEAESTSVRKYVWLASLHVFLERPLLGTGTGAAQKVLMEQYKKEGIARATDRNLNAHNAYCQILVSFGITGFLLLLAALLLPLKKEFQRGNCLYVLFVLLLLINFVTESMLETQAGVMFYGFFNCLLIFSISSGFQSSAIENHD